MAKLRLFSDVLQEIRSAKQSGSLFVNVKESSEDLIRIYFKKGEIYHCTYGSAVGQDCLDIIEYYTWQNATYFDGLLAPPGSAESKFQTDKFISMMKNTNKTVKLP